MRKFIKLGLLSGIALLTTVGLVVAVHWQVKTGEAGLLSKRDGVLQLADSILGEKRFDLAASTDMVFDETDEYVLFGRWGSAPPESEAAGGASLKVMRRDGTDERALADSPVVEARFDRAGKNVYYVTVDRVLYSVGVNGGAVRRMQSKVLSFDLSSDGSRVVYQKLNADWQPGDYFDRALGLTILDLKNGAEKFVSHDWEDFGPIWTPDGRRVLFFSRDVDGNEVHFIVSADGTDRRRLKTPSGETVPVPSERPIWSSDGRYLVYESDRSIWLNEFDVARGTLRSAKRIGYGKHPRWTDDGRAVRVLVGDYGDFSPASTITLDLDGKITK